MRHLTLSDLMANVDDDAGASAAEVGHTKSKP
jgi:hypothetical protein